MNKDDIEKAIEDLYTLLNRGYPKQYAVRFVGDHYGLKNEDRYLLSRTVFPKSYILETKVKKTPLRELKGSHLSIDGYNVIITTESLLMGETFTSMDGLLRDIRNVSRKHRVTKTTLESVDLILGLLERYRPKESTFYLDKMMSQSGRLSEILRNSMEQMGINGDSETITGVDYTLKNMEGIIATNDSAIISQVKRFIDLPSKLQNFQGKLTHPLNSPKE
ncbi:MAG TPA: DUF434 domain-containing protein [Methanofastidiosum sp.]|nr:DUF434 domain-containing protein [Methanofastidiosum sp.]HOC78048.1 DUF434 domain-containing protein [Methanofastidiosum sp.]HOG73819.1 DUF434 domain-containing protein [Methanofastidiosum sp.]HPA49352.1 DUF434 domain-containing protein [Methanofastidiosum sp.]HQK62918.1 DUF434 domain-containing protein [Methanofastidiosum sp.]